MFKRAAFSAIKDARNSFSLSETVDLACLSSKKIFLLIEEINYIEALSIFPLLFNKKKHPNCPFKQKISKNWSFWF
jgi:hypothetical protein